MILEKSAESMRVLWEIPMTGKVHTMNMGFLLFIACFILLVYLVGKKSEALVTMTRKLLASSSQTISFSVFIGRPWNAMIFSSMSVLLTSIILYCSEVSVGVYQMESTVEMLTFFGVMSLLMGVFIIYKYISYAFVGFIFFDRMMNWRWKDIFSASVSVSGFVLFFPALILFFFEPIDMVGLYVVAAYFILLQILLFYRQYLLFFTRKSRWGHFILYLCTQEFIPLFFLYKGYIYFLNLI
jgi:hypothetical protein